MVMVFAGDIPVTNKWNRLINEMSIYDSEVFIEPVFAWTFCCCCTGELANTKLIFGFFDGDVSMIFTVGSLRLRTGVTLALAGLSFKNSFTWEYVLLLQDMQRITFLYKFIYFYIDRKRFEWIIKCEFASMTIPYSCLLSWCGWCLLYKLWLLDRYCTRWFDFIMDLVGFECFPIQRYCVLLHWLLLLHWLNVIDDLWFICLIDILKFSFLTIRTFYFFELLIGQSRKQCLLNIIITAVTHLNADRLNNTT